MRMRADRSETMIRTSITLPESMKEEMERVDVNWSAVFSEAIQCKLEWEREKDTAEAVLVTERLRRKAPEGWDSAKAIRVWRSRRP